MKRLLLGVAVSLALHLAAFALLAARARTASPSLRTTDGSGPVTTLLAVHLWTGEAQAPPKGSTGSNAPPPAATPSGAQARADASGRPTTAARGRSGTSVQATEGSTARDSGERVPVARTSGSDSAGVTTSSTEAGTGGIQGEAGGEPLPAEGPPGDAPGSSVAVPGGGAVGSPPDVRALHDKLAASARRCAPPPARRLNRRHRAPAVATVRFCSDEAGGVADVALVRPSGDDPLDEAARRCVVQGALPLPVDRGCYEVPIRFGE